MIPRASWPEGKRFAFTVFDDTDSETLANAAPVYAFLSDVGFRTTKSVWVVKGDLNQGFASGQTCEDADYLRWLLELQSKGFELAWHNSTWHGLPREQVALALDTFKTLFGHFPFSGANHSDKEGLYWGDARLTGWRRLAYHLVTWFQNWRKYRGHIENDEYFWGDLCRQRIKYYRNFVFRDINTLKACPIMPYHDPKKPFVNYWFASSDGHDVSAFNRCMAEADQDRLEEEGSACIMYTHFSNNFYRNGTLDARFRQLMTRLSRKNGWFVPAAMLLDHLLATNGHREITNRQRRRLEQKWLIEKILVGTN